MEGVLEVGLCVLHSTVPRKLKSPTLLLCIINPTALKHTNEKPAQPLEKPVTHFRGGEDGQLHTCGTASVYFMLPACVWKSLSAAGPSLYITRAETTR